MLVGGSEPVHPATTLLLTCYSLLRPDPRGAGRMGRRESETSEAEDHQRISSQVNDFYLVRKRCRTLAGSAGGMIHSRTSQSLVGALGGLQSVAGCWLSKPYLLSEVPYSPEGGRSWHRRVPG